MFEYGMTTFDAKGYYSDTARTVVYIIINRFQIGRMKETVHTLDPSAYITITEIADVFTAK